MALSQRKSRLLRRLTVNRSRAREALVPVEGVRAVGEALDAGADVVFAVVSPRLESTDEGRTLAARIREAPGVDLSEVADDEMGTLADTEHPQGVVMVCREPQPGLGDVLTAGSRILVLDAVQDPGNVGTLVRSAVAFAFDGVVALDGTADPWSAKAVRASAGTAFHVPLVRTSAEALQEELARRPLPIYVASAEGSAAVRPGDGGFALVVGNEGAGVRAGLRAGATAVVAVPMQGPAESLNVGIAGSILMSDLSRAGK